MDRFDDTEKEDSNLDQTNQDSLPQQNISLYIEPQTEPGNLNGFLTEYYHELQKTMDMYLPDYQEDEYKLELSGVSNQIATGATTSNSQLLLEKSQLPRNHVNDVNKSQDPISDEGSINNYPYNTRHVNPSDDLIKDGNNQEICQESPLISELNKKNRNFETSGKLINYSHSKLKGMVVDKTQAINRKRKATNDQLVTDAIVTLKIPRINSSGDGCELISTDIREKGTSSDSAIEMNAKAKGIEFHEIDGASVSSIVYVHANPGPSGYDEQKHKCTLGAEEFHSEAQEQNFQSKDRETCLICQKGINEHVNECKGERLYKCCVCNYQHKKWKNVRSHISIFGRQHFFCRFCEDAFKKKGSHEIDKICTVCKHPELFPCRTFLVEHLYREHNQVCPSCQNGIHDHISKEKYYKCCTCPKKFLDKYHLERHFIACIMEKGFKCDICGQRFKRSQSLPMHMKFKHYRIDLSF